ncbi:MAG: hypothetical protein ACD_45C00588G0005 [uncultured bacterium]|nr:MAG: hypothetical protein ACD_45C00588G0005 [uncultured bacterium]
MVAVGYFGQYCYTESPKEKRLNNQTLRYFDEKSFIEAVRASYVAHCIVIAGGKQAADNQKIIYYLDPFDAYSKEKHCYYALDYKVFVKRCASFSGIVDQKSNYLLYGPRYTNTFFTKNQNQALASASSTSDEKQLSSTLTPTQ